MRAEPQQHPAAPPAPSAATPADAGPPPPAAVPPPERTLRELGAELRDAVFDLDRGLWPTLRDLVRRPAAVVDAYVQRVKHYTPPMRFLLLTVAAYLLAIQPMMAELQTAQMAQFERRMADSAPAQQSEKAKRTTQAATAATQAALRDYTWFATQPLTVVGVFALPMALAIHWLFRRRVRNPLRVVVSVSYGYAVAMLVTTPIMWGVYLVAPTTAQFVGIVPSMCIWLVQTGRSLRLRDVEDRWRLVFAFVLGFGMTAVLLIGLILGLVVYYLVPVLQKS